MLKKILIANRGEIAVRVIRACRELNIRTVAIYSEVDRSALHVQMADEAYCVGPPQPLESYLNIPKILQVAKDANVEAIHPGYGFLAENSLFAEQCCKKGFVFIGPTPEAIKLLGDKVASRQTMIRTTVPLIPGMKSTGSNMSEFEKRANEIGFPVMIKATAGGGGKGMRVVHEPGDLKKAVNSSMREAKSAFGNDAVYLEKYITNPRHVEFQVLADEHGHAVHLFERECSIQRRHQKIVEETPSPIVDSKLRKKMGAAALEVVAATGYTNAGTVEFLVDDNKDFYFLEVNTRIQVEHPVTEMVTGTDLVKSQIKIAAGEPLPYKQQNLKQKGHAVECRIYAEDPANGFLPSTGKIMHMENPQGPGVRLDSGIFSGTDVSMYYDPILSKVITWGEDRDESIRRMQLALSDYVIMGIQTTIPFLQDVLKHPDFLTGNMTTHFIESNFPDWKGDKKQKNLHPALIAAALISGSQQQTVQTDKSQTMSHLWHTIGDWRIGSQS